MPGSNAATTSTTRGCPEGPGVSASDATARKPTSGLFAAHPGRLSATATASTCRTTRSGRSCSMFHPPVLVVALVPVLSSSCCAADSGGPPGSWSVSTTCSAPSGDRSSPVSRLTGYCVTAHPAGATKVATAPSRRSSTSASSSLTLVARSRTTPGPQTTPATTPPSTRTSPARRRRMRALTRRDGAPDVRWRVARADVWLIRAPRVVNGGPRATPQRALPASSPPTSPTPSRPAASGQIR